jgi:formylglycine-generating enzyme required for sulfatase activity
LAFLAPGRCVLAGLPQRKEFLSERALLVDRFEVSRAQWLEFVAAGGMTAQAVGEMGCREWPLETRSLPATFMTHSEATAFSAWRGMRLLSAGEWILAAAGMRASLYPWGNIPQDSVANCLDLGLGRLAPVGTFEAGRAPIGCYDLCGNAWEWVADSLEGSPSTVGVSALGGSYQTWMRPIHYRTQVNAQDLDLRTRARDLGLRCGVDAEAFLTQRSREWGGDEATRRRLQAVGKRWGRSALPLLEDLVGRKGAPGALAHILEGARH